MLELAVTLFVVLIVVAIFLRYGGIFSLPFFWAAVFVCLYVGLLRICADSGGSSYVYGALGFGMFFLGLLAADLLFQHPRRNAKIKKRDQLSNRDSAAPTPKPDKQSKPTKIRLLFPQAPLQIGLIVSLLSATLITIIFFSEQGIPILSSFPALAWVEATSGITNRLMAIFGPGCYASLGLVAWAMHRETGSPVAKGLMYLGLGLAILAQSLLASKAAALMIFIWFNIVLFYLNKKREFRKSVLPFLIIVIPVSAAIVVVRLMSIRGYWQAGNISQTFASRITTTAAEPLDFIINYSDRFGPTHGGAMRREMARIKDQLTGGHKTPVLSEYIFDLMNGLPQYTTGLSSALTLEGTGYVEWGLVGLLLYSLAQGLGFGWIHRYLLRQETLNLVEIILWGSILSYAMAVCVSGTILIPLESVILGVVVPLASLLPFCFFFLLPIARRYGISFGKRVSKVPQT